MEYLETAIAALSKFSDPAYVLEFAKKNALIILLALIVIVKSMNNKPIKEVEGSLVRSIKSLDHWNSSIENAKNEDLLVVIDYYANWCPPCHAAAPHYAYLSMAYKGQPVVFWKVDVDALTEVARSQNVSSLPTFRIYSMGEGKDGKPTLVELKSQVGWHGAEKLQVIVDEQLVFAANKKKARALRDAGDISASLVGSQ